MLFGFDIVFWVILIHMLFGSMYPLCGYNEAVIGGLNLKILINGLHKTRILGLL